jgi:hypothetical protein
MAFPTLDEVYGSFKKHIVTYHFVPAPKLTDEERIKLNLLPCDFDVVDNSGKELGWVGLPYIDICSKAPKELQKFMYISSPLNPETDFCSISYRKGGHYSNGPIQIVAVVKRQKGLIEFL